MNIIFSFVKKKSNQCVGRQSSPTMWIHPVLVYLLFSHKRGTMGVESSCFPSFGSTVTYMAYILSSNRIIHTTVLVRIVA